MEIKQPTAVRDLAHTIGLESTVIGLITVDGGPSEVEDRVQPDSRLCFFPYVSGG
jgi:hypothetical protein